MYKIHKRMYLSNFRIFGIETLTSEKLSNNKLPGYQQKIEKRHIHTTINTDTRARKTHTLTRI